MLEPFVSIIFNTKQKSVTTSFTDTSFLIMIKLFNHVYHPQQIFYYSDNFKSVNECCWHNCWPQITTQENFVNQKITFPCLPMKQNIFSKKSCHNYIVFLKMQYSNQDQVIMTKKHVMEIHIFKLPHQSV